MKKQFETRIVNVEYNSSVKTIVGWRSVIMQGTATQISEKRVEIIEIDRIDGDNVAGYMSRTGSKSQSYNGFYFAKSESGKLKNISSLYAIKRVD